MRNKENNQNDELELTIAHLAQHMQALRDAVPVNYELKANLKKRLLEQLKQKQAVQGQGRAKEKSKRRQLYIFLSIIGVMAMLLAYFLWPGGTGKIAELTELGTFSVQDLHSERPITVSADGEQVVIEQQGSILLLTKDEGQRTLLKPSEEEGVFHSPSWSNQGDSLAVIYEHSGTSEIWVLQQNKQYASRPIYVAEGVSLSNVQWSVDDQWVITQTMAEVIQVRQDGSDVVRSAMIEDKTEQELRESLADIKWPKMWRDKLASASRLWMDWNGRETALVVGMQGKGEQMDIVLIQLKRTRLK